MATFEISDNDMPELVVRCNCNLSYGREGKRDPNCEYCVPVHGVYYGVRPSPFAYDILRMLERFQGKVKVL